MCFVFIWEQTATCATYSINWLVFIAQMKSVYSAVRTGSLNKAVCASSLEGWSSICFIRLDYFFCRSFSGRLEYNSLFVGQGGWSGRGNEREDCHLGGGWERDWARCLDSCTGRSWEYVWDDYRLFEDIYIGKREACGSWRDIWSSS